MSYSLFLIAILTAAGLMQGGLADYECEIRDENGRVQLSTTASPCTDSNGMRTCRGGKSEEYVKCRCNSETGAYPPATSCWKPGTRVTINGQCNNAISRGTAIATFDSSGKYAGHAAVFMGCPSASVIQAYDQMCSKAIGYSTYKSGHPYYLTFAVVTDTGCAEVTTKICSATTGSAVCADT